MRRVNNSDNEQELIERAVNGDSNAFAALVKPIHAKLRAVIRRYIKNEDDIDDCLQEACIKIFGGLPAFRGDSAFYTYAFRIAVNVAKNKLVADSRRVNGWNATSVDNDDVLIDTIQRLQDHDSPEALLIAEQESERLAAAIKKLPPMLSEALILREIDGLGYGEVAAIAGIPIGTVRSRIYRARNHLCAALGIDLPTHHSMAEQAHC